MCCFSQKTIKCCSKCLCFTSLVLFLCMCALGLLGVMVSKQQIFERLSMDGDLVDNVDFIDLSKGANFILSMIIIILCLTCLAVLFTWLTKLTMNKSILCTSISTCFFFSLFIFFMIMGSVLVYPGTVGQEFINENCQLAKENKLGEVSPFFRSVFEEIVYFDHKLHKSINLNMCTE